MMRMRLARRSELLTPLALLIPALAGREWEATALAAACALGRLCTLCGAEGFRRAAAQEVSPSRVRGAWTGALLASLLLALAAYLYGPAVWTWLFAEPPQQGTWTALWCVGAALPLARLADEHLRAAGQGGTALLSAFLRAVLLAASAFCGLAWMAGAAALCALLALTLACAVAGRPFAVPNAAAVARMPVAALRALLCPVPALLLLAGLWRYGSPWAASGYLLATALYACAATPFRRDERESAPARLLFAVPAAVFCALAPFAAFARPLAALTAFAALTGLSVFAAFAPRALLSALLLLAACLLTWLLPAAAPLRRPALRAAGARRAAAGHAPKRSCAAAPRAASPRGPDVWNGDRSPRIAGRFRALTKPTTARIAPIQRDRWQFLLPVVDNRANIG